MRTALKIGNRKWARRGNKAGLKKRRMDQEKIFWVDLEMTGLDYSGKDKIMEFASVVTDGQFNVIKVRLLYAVRIMRMLSEISFILTSGGT